jgi:pimeloyl-ACP methyl ester carboxylesterase
MRCMPTIVSPLYVYLQGSLLKFTTRSLTASPPSCVLVHGILGSRRNLQSFANRILEANPSWQVILVDLRNHGDSPGASTGISGPHSVEACATDVLSLLTTLRLFPSVIVGHSFGGKVVLSMAQQFAIASGATTPGARLPRPVDVWVLDTTPGEVRLGFSAENRQDHPEDLIQALMKFPSPVSQRRDVVNYLQSRGFSTDIARWMTTNLKAHATVPQALDWSFDLPGVAEMYQSYTSTDMTGLVRERPEGLALHFVRAERSTFRWDGQVVADIEMGGGKVHLLRNAVSLSIHTYPSLYRADLYL